MSSPFTLQFGAAAVSLPGVALLGIVVGLIAGMFGVGGGFLLTPLLTVVLGVPLPISIGSGLCQMVGTSLSALLRHREIGQGELRFDLLMLPGTVLGVDAGARVLAMLEHRGSVHIGHATVSLVSLFVETTYVLGLGAIALLFWRQARGGIEWLEYVRSGPFARLRFGPSVPLEAIGRQPVSAILVAEIGLALGFLGGFLGIGGGVALMPVLIYGYGFPIRQAAGTGILVLTATAITGTLRHAALGHVSLVLSMVLLAGASVSAQFGAMLTRRVSTRVLRRVFAFVVVLTAIAVAVDMVRRIA